MAGEEQIGNGGSDEEDGSDESFGEGCQGDAGIDPIEAIGAVVFEAGDEGVEGNEQEEAELRLGDDEASKEKWADGGEHGKTGIEAGALSPGAASPEPGKPGEAEHGERIRQVGGKGVLAEDLVGTGDDPVGERRFLDVADAVDLGGDEVAGLRHVLRGLGVSGVDVVKQRGRKERSKLHGGKDGCQKQPDSERGGSLAWAIDGLRVESRFGGHR